MICVLFLSSKDSSTRAQRTYDPFILQTHWYNNKTDIEKSHDNAHRFGHFPIEKYDGQEDENQH